MSDILSSVTRKKWFSSLLILTLLIVVTFLHVRLYQYAFDDAYIHFRVARNFVETGSPYYNPNEMLKVSTNTAWMLLLTLIYSGLKLISLQESLPLVVSIFNSVFTCSCVLVINRFVEKIAGHKLTFLERSILCISVVGLLLQSSIGLMETPLALLMFLFGLFLLSRQKLIGTFLFGVSIYLRIELLIPTILILIFMLLKKQFSWKHISGVVLGLLPFIIFDLLYFGTVIPQSIIAKPIVYGLDRSQTLALIIFNSIPHVYFFDSTVLNGIIFVGLVTLVLYVIIKQKRITLDWSLFFYGWGVFLILFYLDAKAYVFEWYQPLYTIPIFVSGFILLVMKKVKALQIHLVALALVLSIGLFSTVMASSGQKQMYSYFVGGSRVKNYLSVGKILYSEYPGSNLLTSEIGGLGYSFQGKIVDAAGLTTTQALEFHPLQVPQERSGKGIGAIPPRFVRQIMPDLIVSYDQFTEALLKDDVLKEYSEIKVPAFLPEDEKYSRNALIWGSKYLRIFIRKDHPISKRLLEQLQN